MPKLVGEDLDPKYVKKVSCPSCARRMEYLQMEVVWVPHSGHGGGGNSMDGYVLCPCCKKQIPVGSR